MSDANSTWMPGMADSGTADLIADEILHDVLAELQRAIDEALGTAALMGISTDMVRNQIVLMIDEAINTTH